MTAGRLPWDALVQAGIGRNASWNGAAAIAAVRALRDEIGLAVRPADFGVAESDYRQIAADALDDEVLSNPPRPPTSADICEILRAAQSDE